MFSMSKKHDCNENELSDLIWNIVDLIFLIVFLIQFLWIFFKIFGPYFLFPRKDLHKLAGAKWAVVTGATDGIGREFAYELAKMKFNIILISRSQSRLDATVKELAADFPDVKFRSIVFDFTAPTSDEYQPLFDELFSYEIGILVNNVGATMECPEILHKVRGDKAELARISTINTLPMLMLSSYVLEYMAPRKKGVIINIASGFAQTKAAQWNVFSASKNYALTLSRTLRKEYSEFGITIQTLTPVRVATKSLIPKVEKPSFFVPSPECYARSALRTVGIVNETAGFCAHQLQIEFNRFLPSCLYRRIQARTTRNVRHSIRKLEGSGKC